MAPQRGAAGIEKLFGLQANLKAPWKQSFGNAMQANVNGRLLRREFTQIKGSQLFGNLVQNGMTCHKG